MVTLLFIYYAISCLFLLLVARKLPDLPIIAVITLLVPLIGLIVAYFLFFVKVQPRQIEEDQVDIQQPILSQVNLTVELNRVPIVDALTLNDNHIKRSALIESLKENAIQNVEILSMALENEDTETSHYAATAILEMKRKLSSSLQELSVKVEADPSNIELLQSYANVLKKQIDNKFLDPISLRKYKYTYTNILERLIELSSDDPNHYVEKINIDLDLGEYQKAFAWCEQFLRQYPFVEDSHLMMLKYFYQMKDSESFHQTLANLKKSSVRLSTNGLNMIRYWN